MTIKQLSEEAKIPVNTLYSITKRDSIRVDPVIASRICDTLGVSVQELLSLRPEIDTPENRQSIETGLVAFLEAADEYARKKKIRQESIHKAWKAAEAKEGRKLSFDEAMEHYKVNVSDSQRIEKAFRKLNMKGRKIAVERIEELTQIAEYTLPIIPEDTESTEEYTDTDKQKKPSEGDTTPTNGK